MNKQTQKEIKAMNKPLNNHKLLYEEGFEDGRKSKEKEMIEMIDCREFNEKITKIMNKNGFITDDDNECIWVTCNVVKDYIKEELIQKLKGDEK